MHCDNLSLLLFLTFLGNLSFHHDIKYYDFYFVRLWRCTVRYGDALYGIWCCRSYTPPAVTCVRAIVRMQRRVSHTRFHCSGHAVCTRILCVPQFSLSPGFGSRSVECPVCAVCPKCVVSACCSPHRSYYTNLLCWL